VNTATKITELPALTADLLQSNSCLVDNLFAWGLLKQAIEQEMQNKGYTQIADAGQADLNISFMAALESSMGDAEIAQKYGLVPRSQM
jgi:hypothetical protein